MATSYVILGALLSHRPILQMWTLRYRSGDTALAMILNELRPLGAQGQPLILFQFGGGGGGCWESAVTLGAEQGQDFIQLSRGRGPPSGEKSTGGIWRL